MFVQSSKRRHLVRQGLDIEDRTVIKIKVPIFKNKLFFSGFKCKNPENSNFKL